MVVKKEKPKALSLVKTDFVNSLQNVINQGNLLLVVLETALQHGAVNMKIRDVVEERVKLFRTAMYGEGTAMYGEE